MSCTSNVGRTEEVIKGGAVNEIIKHCLPDEEGDDVLWFYRLNEFEKQETKRQVTFKRSRWSDLADGIWSKRPNYQYPHILPENNIWNACGFPQSLNYNGEGDWMPQ